MMPRKRILHEISLDKISAVTLPCQEHAKATIIKRAYTEKEREKMAEKGHAMSDGSFPIANETDLKNAIQSFGRAKDKEKAKSHITARAKALGASDQLPEDWSVSKSQLMIEMLCKVDESAARGFAEVLAEAQVREAQWDAETKMWPLFDALRCSLSSIATDPTLDNAGRITRVNQSVQEFIQALQQEWPDVAEEVSAIAKASPNADRMSAFLKAGSASETMEGYMAKTVAELEKELGEMTKANEGLQTELAKAKKDMEDLKDGGADEAMEDDAGKPTKKGLNFIAKHSTADETLTIAGHTVRKSAVGEAQFAIFKAQAEENANIRKESVITKMEKRVAEEFPLLTGSTTEKGAVLAFMESAPETVKKTFTEILTAAETAMKSAFGTLGSNAGAPATVKKATEDFMSKVVEVQARDKIGKASAMSKARAEYPDLFKAYQEAEESAREAA